MSQEQMMLVIRRRRDGKEISRQVVDVRRTAKRIRCLSREPEWFDLEGRDLTRKDERCGCGNLIHNRDRLCKTCRTYQNRLQAKRGPATVDQRFIVGPFEKFLSKFYARAE